MTEVERLLAEATSRPWIRPWGSLEVHAPGRDDLFGRLIPSINHPRSHEAQTNIDLAVYVVNRLATSPLDAGVESRWWGEMADRLESLWDKYGSEEMQGLYFALDQARGHESRLAALNGQMNGQPDPEGPAE